METFEAYRPMMFGIAYRMLGSAMEAEDMVQEAYLRYQTTPPERIRSLKSFLATVITHLCLDQMKSARVQRETYLGPWLPEPVLTGDYAAFGSPLSQIMDYESISMAFLVLLENLSPAERAVFLLREAFDYDYAEIADIVGKDEAACRQLFSRAKKHISEHRPRFQSTPEEHNEILSRFMEAVGAGDLDGLTSLLADDVTSWADGGGRVRGVATRPVQGRDHVARYVLGIARRAPGIMRFTVAEVNGRLALVTSLEGKPFAVFNFAVANRRIQNLYVVLNPYKLGNIYQGG